MPCYHPIPAWRPKPPYENKRLVFNPVFGIPSTLLYVPCGRCVGCQASSARAWAVRCYHEALTTQPSCFLTLTFAEAPPYDTDFKRTIVLFLKRLRKAISTPIRFFLAFEYGELYARPHYHLLLFGYDFPDRVLFSVRAQDAYFFSDQLRTIWPYGYHVIGAVTLKSANYVARYLQKSKVSAPDNPYLYPEWRNMSRRPGLGYYFWQRYRDDLLTGTLSAHLPEGRKAPIPTYYLYRLQLEDPDAYAAIKAARLAYVAPPDYRELGRREETALYNLKRVHRLYDSDSALSRSVQHRPNRSMSPLSRY